MERRLEKMKTEYENITVPKEALDRIKLGIEEAKSEKKVVRFSGFKKAAAGMAAAIAICFVAVNSSASVANAMSSIPIIGKFFEVITIRDYSQQTGNASVSVKEPRINAEGSDAAASVNRETSDYINGIMAQFEKDCLDSNIDYRSLDISYDVLTDTDDYFALDVTGYETGADGYEFHKFYTIDKKSDKVLRLSDIFAGNDDYIRIISDEIIRQMKADTGTDYFIGGEDGFKQIAADQEFYVDKDGNLVVCFDEFEVGPGSIGAPRFTISKDIVKMK